MYIFEQKRNIMTAVKEANKMNLFKEYKALKKYKKHSNFQLGRYLVFEGVIDMLRFDPESGDMKNIMSEHDFEYWDTLSGKIIEGGKLLYKGGEQNLFDPLLWLFIPQRFHREIEIKWSFAGLCLA